MTLLRCFDPADAAQRCRSFREDGLSIGFVPTMGALHDGHLELVRRARAENDRVVVSVFVNPLQFDAKSDLDAYPRDFAKDCDALESVGTDLAFTGELLEFFPEYDRAEEIEQVDPGPAAVELEGAERPGHFAGVATIVRRLFDLVRPTAAYFGEKDFQQTLVVQHVAARTGGPSIVVVPTQREASGLARSSRNERLAPADRVRAASIAAALRATSAAWRAGERDAARLTSVLRRELQREAALEVEYAELRNPVDLGRVAGEIASARCVVAARIGGVRLIDNALIGAEVESHT